jgi:hypothetical protein
MTYRANVSYFIGRRQFTLTEHLCWPCATKTFIGYELLTLVGTWWGLIGFIVGPFFLIDNIIQYVRASYCFAFKKTKAAKLR